MKKPAQQEISANTLVRQGLIEAGKHLPVLLMMALVAGITSAIGFSSLADLLAPLQELGNTPDEAASREALAQVTARLWQVGLAFLLVLFMNAILLTPWARLTAAFGLSPLGQDAAQHRLRVFSVLWRQISIWLYWFLIIVLGLQLMQVLAAGLPDAMTGLLSLLMYLFFILALIVLMAFMNALIISDSCFGRQASPVTVKLAWLFMRPIAGALILLIAIGFLVDMIIGSILTALAPAFLKVTVSLIVSGFVNFMVTALHIAALNRIPVWQGAVQIKIQEPPEDPEA